VQNEASRNTDPAVESRRASLQSALETNCRTAQPRAAQNNRGNLLELLFGDNSKSMFDSEMPDEPLAKGLPTDEKGYGYRTICVRSCDGYYFPISSNASQRRLTLDADLCRSSCPNAETALYLVPIGQDAEMAVSVEGHTPYPTLANAFKYRRGVDPSCSCRKQGQSWSEALAEAERLLVQNGRSEGPISEQRASSCHGPAVMPPKAKPLIPTRCQQHRPHQCAGCLRSVDRGHGCRRIEKTHPSDCPTQHQRDAGISLGRQTRPHLLRPDQGEQSLQFGAMLMSGQDLP